MTKQRFLAAFLFAAVFAVMLFIPAIARKFVYPMKFREAVEKYSAENSLDKNFVYAVIKTESNFDPEAVSDAGAKGLMQIMENTFDWVQFKMNDESCSESYSDICDPEINIKYGTFLLRLLLDEYGSEETAAAAYHSGRGNVNSWLENKNYSADGMTLDDMPSSVTKHYVKKVMTAYNGYNNLYQGV